MPTSLSTNTMPPSRESNGCGKRRVKQTQYYREKDEEYLRKRAENNKAVRICREKSKKETEKTRQRVMDLKEEIIWLKAKISGRRDQLTVYKGLFPEHAAGEESSEVKFINKLLRETDIGLDAEPPIMTTLN